MYTRRNPTEKASLKLCFQLLNILVAIEQFAVEELDQFHIVLVLIVSAAGLQLHYCFVFLVEDLLLLLYGLLVAGAYFSVARFDFRQLLIELAVVRFSIPEALREALIVCADSLEISLRKPLSIYFQLLFQLLDFPGISTAALKLVLIPGFEA